MRKRILVNLALNFETRSSQRNAILYLMLRSQKNAGNWLNPNAEQEPVRKQCCDQQRAKHTWPPFRPGRPPAESSNAIGKLANNHHSHQPPDAVLSKGARPVPRCETDRTSGQPTPGTRNPKQNPRSARLRRGNTRHEPQFYELIIPRLQTKRQNYDRDCHREHGDVMIS